jgi:hypothetical protein
MVDKVLVSQIIAALEGDNHSGFEDWQTIKRFVIDG